MAKRGDSFLEGGVREISLVDVPVLASLDEPGGWMYDGLAAVRRAVALDLWGNDDTVSSAEEQRVELKEQKSTISLYAVACEDETPEGVVGWGFVGLPMESNPTLAYVDVTVRPDRWRRGIGTLLMAWVEKTAAAHGRTSLLGWVDFAEPAPERPTVTASHGGDVMPADEPGFVVALQHGYTLRQVERRSLLDLPVDDGLLTRLLDDARAHADGYRVHRWLSAPPEEWLDKLAALTTRMTTDPPLGDMTMDEDPWDADRLRRLYATVAAQGRDFVTTAAEHVSSGDLVAYTNLQVPRDKVSADQEDTIVARDHRGHRLGMLVKAENLRFLAQVGPHIERVYTWNASENTHMLAINTALGFRPAGGSATVQRG